MVSHLSEDDLKYVVQGPEGCSCGILKCSVEPKPGSYDHETHGRELPVFDFVIWRNDDSRASMHPSWNEIEICCHEGLPSQPARGAAKGVGKSHGHGPPYRPIMSAQFPVQLHFRDPL